MSSEKPHTVYDIGQLRELALRDLATAALVGGGAEYGQWEGNDGTYRQQLYLTRAQLDTMAFPGTRFETTQELLAVSVVDAWRHMYPPSHQSTPIGRIPALLKSQANVTTLADLLMLGSKTTGNIPRIGTDWALRQLQQVMSHFLTPVKLEWSLEPLTFGAIRAITTDASQVNAAVLQGWYDTHRPYKHTVADVPTMSDAEIASFIAAPNVSGEAPLVQQASIDAIRGRAAVLASLYAAQG